MKLRRIYVLVILLVLLTACGNDRETTPTLQGALVPTRVSPTPTATATVSPSITPLPTSSFDATRTRIAALGSATALSIEQTQTEDALATLTPTPSPTDTATRTSTPSVTWDASPTPSPTVTLSPTRTELPITPTPVTPTPVITTVPDFADALPITYGERVLNAITDIKYAVIYRFEATAGDVITIDMKAINNNLDTLLFLTDLTGERLAENDDRAVGDTNSLISDFTIPSDGPYFIIATRFQEESGSFTGVFELTVSLAGDQSTPTPDDAQLIQYGANVRGTINNERYQFVYLFEGLAGDRIEIRMAAARNSDLDTYLYLYAPDETLVAQNDDFQGNSRISVLEEIELPQSGTYRIIATRFNEQFGGSSGNFNLMLNLLERGSSQADPELDIDEISYGDFIRDEITEDQLLYFYGFEGEEGERIVLSVYPVVEGSGGLDPIVLLLDNVGRELIRSDDNSFNRSSLISNYALPYTGNYIIIVGRSPLRGGRSLGEFRLLFNNNSQTDIVIGTLPQSIAEGETVTVEFTRLVEDAVITFEGNAGNTVNITLDPDRRLAITAFLVHPLGRESLYVGEANEITLNLPLDGFYSLSFRARRGQGEMDITVDFE